MCTTLMRATRVRQKAGREERRERRKGRGKRGERRAGTGSAEEHTPCWESSQGYPGVLKQEAGAGVSLAPFCRGRHKAASRTSWKVLPCPRHFKPQNNFPVPASLLNPLGASPTASQRAERGVWGAGTTESTFLHLRANTSPGADGSLAARIPQLPSLQAVGTESSSCSGTAATSPGWFAGLRAAGKGKAARQSPAAHAMQTAQQEASPKVLVLEQRGRSDPFPLGSRLRTHQLSCGCRTGRKGEENTN